MIIPLGDILDMDPDEAEETFRVLLWLDLNKKHHKKTENNFILVFFKRVKKLLF